MNPLLTLFQLIPSVLCLVYSIAQRNNVFLLGTWINTLFGNLHSLVGCILFQSKSVIYYIILMMSRLLLNKLQREIRTLESLIF